MRVAACQRDELPTSGEEERTAENEQRTGARLHERREGSIEFAFTCGFHDQDLPPDGATCRLTLSQLNFDLRLVRVHQHGNDGGLGNQLVQQPKPLAPPDR